MVVAHGADLVKRMHRRADVALALEALCHVLVGWRLKFARRVGTPASVSLCIMLMRAPR